MLERRVLLSAGDPDPSIGAGTGRALVDFGGTDHAAAIIVLGDGKVLAAGAGGAGGEVAIARFTAAGSLDTSFGRGGPDGDGQASIDFGSERDTGWAVDLAELLGGKFLVVGTHEHDGTYWEDLAAASGTQTLGVRPQLGMVEEYVVIARFNADGTPDTSFGKNGQVRPVFEQYEGADCARSVIVRPDGRFLVTADLLMSGRAVLARFNPESTSDASFGQLGYVFESARTASRQTATCGYSAAARSSSALPRKAATPSTAITRTARATPPSTATVSPPPPPPAAPTTSPSSPTARWSSRERPCPGRASPSGSTSCLSTPTAPSTGPSGPAGPTATASSPPRCPAAPAPPACGSAAAASCTSRWRGRASPARFNPDGTLDATFGPGGADGSGVATADFGPGASGANSLDNQPDGRPVVAGSAAGNFALARFVVDDPGPDGDGNDQLSEAGRLRVGAGPLTQGISGRDVDLYAFAAVAGQRVGFDVDPAAPSALDAYLRVFAADGTELAANDNAAAPGEAAGKSPYAEFTFSAAGTYFVGVSEARNLAYSPLSGTGDTSGAGATSGGFTLALTDRTPTRAADGNDQLTEASPRPSAPRSPASR